MPGHNVRDDLAQVARVLAHHQMIDLWGHLSLRIPKSDLILATPRFTRACLPRSITGEQLLVCDPDGRVVEGNGALPLQFEVDLALYRAHPDAGACIFASPQTAMAAGIARCALQPLTHHESEVAYRLQFWEGAALAETRTEAAALAGVLARSGAVQQPGIGAWAAGEDIHRCLMTVYHLEYLAQANLLIAGKSAAQSSVVKADSDKLWSQFTSHHHYHEFFAALDPGPLAHPYPRFLEQHRDGSDPYDELKAAIAMSCRALWERGTLVAFFEHISHRLPASNRFLITATAAFRDMRPADICLLDYQANWLAGPRPPEFKWFHAQIISERPDVQAIVHTHDLYGRVYHLASRALQPAYRLGLGIATLPLPSYPRCDLIVDREVRRQTIDALGAGPVVHEAGHGTDFVAATLEQATVDAIQREAFIAMHHLAERFGEPRPLPDAVVTRIAEVEADPRDWWWFYCAEVGAPRRSAGGL